MESARLPAVLAAAAVASVLALLATRRRAARLEERCREIEEAHASTQRALSQMNRAQRELDLCALPPLPDVAVMSTGWKRCAQALLAVEDGYARFDGKRTAPKATLISNFVEARPQPHKAEVDALLARHVLRAFPDLCGLLAASPALVLLILDAPTCCTVGSLLDVIPQLAAHGSRITIPQADPAHYVRQVRGATGEQQQQQQQPEEEDPAAVHASVRTATPLHIRNQRLDQWLSSHRRCAGLRVPVAFFDFEASLYGRPKVKFQPLHDLQLFFRLGYPARPICLLGVTLSFRAPHESRYEGHAAALTPSDLEGFVASEASAVGLRSTLIETVRYGLTFFLFELVAVEST